MQNSDPRDRIVYPIHKLMIDSYSLYEPQHEKTNNVVFDQVWHKPGYTATGGG